MLGYRIINRWFQHLFSGVTINAGSGGGLNTRESESHSPVSEQRIERRSSFGNTSPRGSGSPRGSPKIKAAERALPGGGLTSGGLALLSPSQLRSHFAESILRYLPVCVGGQGGLEQVEQGSASPVSPNPNSNSVPLPIFMSSPPAFYGEGTSGKESHYESVGVGYQMVNRLGGLLQDIGVPVFGPFLPGTPQQHNDPTGAAAAGAGIDSPPAGVTELLDHFYPSKMHKQ